MSWTMKRLASKTLRFQFACPVEKAEQENQCDIDRVCGKNLEQPPRQEDRGVLPLDVTKYQIAAQEKEEQHATAPERRDVMGELAEDDPVRKEVTKKHHQDRNAPQGIEREKSLRPIQAVLGTGHALPPQFPRGRRH